MDVVFFSGVEMGSLGGLLIIARDKLRDGIVALAGVCCGECDF